MFQIIAGSNSLSIAQKLANAFNCSLISNCKHTFADQEIKIQLPADINYTDIIIVQSTSKPVNDSLIELLLTADTAKRTSAKQITAVVPYFGYSRQDKTNRNFESIAAELVANFFETAGINRIITLDLHAPKIEKFFKIKVINLSTTTLFAAAIGKQKNLVIVAPDSGSKTRAEQLAKLLDAEIAIINKHRTTQNECVMSELQGNVHKKNCIIVDDIIDTGETLCKATELLLNKGALSVTAAVTHAVLSNNISAKIETSQIAEVITTNSITHKNLPNKFKVLDVTNILQKELELMHTT